LRGGQVHRKSGEWSGLLHSDIASDGRKRLKRDRKMRSMENEFGYIKLGTNERREMNMIERHSMGISERCRNNSSRERKNEIRDEEI
jgi:hypothetical protein